MNRKVAYLFPGYGQVGKNSLYKKIGGWFQEKGITPVYVENIWPRKTINDWVSQFLEIYNKNNQSGDIVYFFGFSYGSLVAFASSDKVNPKAQILGSLSPYFKEDLPKLPNSWRRELGKKQTEALLNTSFNKIASKLTGKVFLLLGAKEGVEMDMRFNEAKKVLKNYEAIIIPDNDHDLRDEKYLEAIKSIIDKLD